MHGLTKIIKLDSTTPNGEARVQILNFSSIHRIKTASEAKDYILNVKPKPGKTIVLVLAMGASEAYGPNRNGDAFSEQPIPGLVEEGETLLDHYQTFTDAGIYMHHVNTDKTKSMGKVLKAFYNKEMRRVELLLELDDIRAAKVVNRIKRGEYPAVSMGCKIKYDVCARCKNKASKPEFYCKHAKKMNYIDPGTGKMNFVYNPSPRLFDISFVFRPADRIAFTMKKVAHGDYVPSSASLGEQILTLNEKLSTVRKLSEMNKELLGQVVDANPRPKGKIKFLTDVSLPKAMANSAELKDSDIKELAKCPLPISMSTLDSMGIMPTTVEVTKIMITRAGGKKLPKGVETRIPGLQDKLLQMFEKFPEILKSLEDTGLVKLSYNLVDESLKATISPLVEKRSNLKDYVYRRTIGDPYPEQGKMNLQVVQDPDGETYTTTRSAVENAQDANLERRAKTLAGSGLLAGTAYKILSSNRIGKALSPLLLGAAAYGTKKLHDDTEVPTFQGSDIPINTELHKLSSSSPSDVSMYAMLAQEYYSDTHHDATVAKTAAPFLEQSKNLSTKHAAFNFLNSLSQPSWTVAPTIDNFTSQFIEKTADSVELNDVNIDDLCYWLGDALYSEL